MPWACAVSAGKIVTSRGSTHKARALAGKAKAASLANGSPAGNSRTGSGQRVSRRSDCVVAVALRVDPDVDHIAAGRQSRRVPVEYRTPEVLDEMPRRVGVLHPERVAGVGAAGRAGGELDRAAAGGR